MTNAPIWFHGMRIVINDTRCANRSLAKDVPVSPEFREEINAWMLDFFGTTPLIPDGTFYASPLFSAAGGPTHYCNSTTFEYIKKTMEKLG